MAPSSSNQERHLSDQNGHKNLGRRGATRQKILEAAYDLFVADGVQAVGVDTISAHSGVAKMTLYHHFRSKEALVLAFLDLREKKWTVGWLKAEVTRRTRDPRDGLLAIFDLYDEWFGTRGFEGCPLTRVLCESPVGSTVHKAGAAKVDQLLKFTIDLAREAKLPDPKSFGHAWMILMQGAAISARGGHRDAARKAKRAGVVLLQSWAASKPAPKAKRAVSTRGAGAKGAKRR